MKYFRTETRFAEKTRICLGTKCRFSRRSALFAWRVFEEKFHSDFRVDNLLGMSRISANTLAVLYREAAERFGDLPAFAAKDSSGVYQPISYRQLYEDGLALATALIDLGLRQREHVGLLSDNRPEWILCDYGVLLAGCADVPRGTDVTEAEIAHILAHSDSRFVFVENTGILEKFERVRHSVRGVEKIILMDPKASASAAVLRLQDLVARGRTLRAAGDRRAEERIANVRPEDLFTIIYTSGTTGTPKGVQLTHANMTSQVRNLPFSLGPGDRALTILPVWHCYERVFEMVAISMGACTYYTNLRSIGEDLKTVRPTVMASAPRLWENLYQKLMARIDEAPRLAAQPLSSRAFLHMPRQARRRLFPRTGARHVRARSFRKCAARYSTSLPLDRALSSVLRPGQDRPCQAS